MCNGYWAYNHKARFDVDPKLLILNLKIFLFTVQDLTTFLTIKKGILSINYQFICECVSAI